jgi:hypothetical protein
MVTTNVEIGQLIFIRGVYLETKFVAAQFETNTDPATFPGSTITNDNGFIHEQLTALTAKLRSMKKPGTYGQGGRGRGKCMGSSWDSESNTRECYECGKTRHIRPDCPDLPRNKKKHDVTKNHAGSAVVASLDRDATLLAHVAAVETTWVVDTGASCYCSSVRSDFANLMISSMDTNTSIECEVEGLGDVVINVSNTQGNCIFTTLKDVLTFRPGS